MAGSKDVDGVTNHRDKPGGDGLPAMTVGGGCLADVIGTVP